MRLRARYFVRKIHMTRCVNEVELIGFTVGGGVIEGNALSLNRDPRSRSSSMESSTWASISRADKPPQC